VWVDAQAFEQICSNGESRAALLHRAVGGSPAPPERRIKYRPCARCGKMMNRINFARLSGTVVDVCRGHGTFLDAGELHAIVAFIQKGGLERVRQRSLEELKEEQRRLRTAQEISKGPNAGSSAASRSWDGPSLERILEAIFG
jgi:hypothetical protein